MKVLWFTTDLYPYPVCLKKRQAYSVTQELISDQYILTTIEYVHRSLSTWGHAGMRHLPSLELWAELWEAAEVFWAEFGLTECTCAQTHTVSASASSACLTWSLPLWEGLECEEIKFSLCLFLKYPFLSYAYWSEIVFSNSGCTVFLDFLSLRKPDIHLCVWS